MYSVSQSVISSPFSHLYEAIYYRPPYDGTNKPEIAIQNMTLALTEITVYSGKIVIMMILYSIMKVIMDY